MADLRAVDQQHNPIPMLGYLLYRCRRESRHADEDAGDVGRRAAQPRSQAIQVADIRTIFLPFRLDEEVVPAVADEEIGLAGMRRAGIPRDAKVLSLAEAVHECLEHRPARGSPAGSRVAQIREAADRPRTCLAPFHPS